MLIFEAMNAQFGDALLLRFSEGKKPRLWLIDGGPPGTWKDTLRPRLEELANGLPKLVVDVAMLSHVDADHVAGMLQMTKGLALKQHNAADFLEIRRFWHNSFADLAGSEASLKKGMASLAAVQSSAAAAMASANPVMTAGGKQLDRRVVAVMASIAQGRELRDYIETLGLSGNSPFGKTLTSKIPKQKIDGAVVTIVGPIKSRLEAFRKEWDKAAGKAAAVAALFREDLDESPTNLSSLVMLVEVGKRKLLLTGDARGDDVIDGFKDAKLGKDLPMKLDILKMPHHGSDRNITKEFLESFIADHYVISADGKFGNPDPGTLQAIVSVRGSDSYKIHFTNTVPKLPALMKKLSKGKNFEYEFRDSKSKSIAIEL